MLYIENMSFIKPSDAFHTNRDAICRIIEAHRACNPRVFSSLASGTDTEASDLDLLVDPTADTTLLDIGAIRHELLELLGVPVDVVTPGHCRKNFAPQCWQKQCRCEKGSAHLGQGCLAAGDCSGPIPPWKG